REKRGGAEVGEERIAEGIGRTIPQPTLQPAATLVKPLSCFFHVINSCSTLFNGQRHRYHPCSSSCIRRFSARRALTRNSDGSICCAARTNDALTHLTHLLFY